ncbi:PF03932 family protein CutC [Pararobbsia alpina]|uniref:copper homeostasis protein CutC n=1 Tax=Pararobbsia alpina TaxID=621374 RepID=UPI0039A4806D
MITLEVCVDNLAGLRIAAAAPIARIELCGPLAVGGTTPPTGVMRIAARMPVPVYAMIRPRDGDFVFDADDEAAMIADIHAARSAGLAGVVLGASQADGSLDVPMLARLSSQCAGLGRTLHRAFDLCPDPFAALDAAIELGFERVLTSGRAKSAIEGAPLLAELREHGHGRISIMAGAGVTPSNVRELVEASGVHEVHASCRSAVPIGNPDVIRFGFASSVMQTDRAVIDAMLEAIAEKQFG